MTKLLNDIDEEWRAATVNDDIRYDVCPYPRISERDPVTHDVFLGNGCTQVAIVFAEDGSESLLDQRVDLIVKAPKNQRLLNEIYEAAGHISHSEIVRLLKVATHKQEGGK